MALSLQEASKINKGDVVRATVIEMYARASDLLNAMQWMNIPGGAYHYTQEGKLPGVAFRGVNQGYSASTGIMNPLVEVLRIAGGELDVDKSIIAMLGPEVRATHEAMKIKSLALYLAKKLIKGDSETNPLEFDGLQNRITGSQLIWAGSTDGGNALSLDKLDEAIDAVDEPTHIIMSKAMKRKLTAAARDTDVGGYISYGLDGFGKKVTLYNDLPILIADYDDEGARILDFNEVGSTGSTATATSIYIVSIGEGKLIGLQNGTMEVEDLGDIKTLPVLRTRVEWYIGLAALHGRCAARLGGISNAAIVA